VYVTGTLGAAAAGLQMLRAGSGTLSATECSSAAESCIERYLRPEPRLRVGILLGRNRAASACIDLSDGLADGVHQIADASGVGMVLDAAALPVDKKAYRWFESHDDDPIERAIVSGDDYELLFTVRPRDRGRLNAVARDRGARITRIGVCTAERAVLLRRVAGARIADAPFPRGYTHFR
jgi:thiamine-monophosphate kinase